MHLKVNDPSKQAFKSSKIKNLNVTAYTNINSKWITELNIKHKTIKLGKKQRRKSSAPRARPEVLRLDIKMSKKKNIDKCIKEKY